MKAQCQCGQIAIELPSRKPFVVACHCLDCQRRSGSAYGLLAYYAASELVITGTSKCFIRSSADGNQVKSYFCPECGTSIYVQLDKQPTLIGVAVGTIANPGFYPPDISVWEDTMHSWASIPGAKEHFAQGTPE